MDRLQRADAAGERAATSIAKITFIHNSEENIEYTNLSLRLDAVSNQLIQTNQLLLHIIELLTHPEE